MNILERIKLIHSQLNVQKNVEALAKRDIRFAGQALSGINPEGLTPNLQTFLNRFDSPRDIKEASPSRRWRQRTGWVPGIVPNLQWSPPKDQTIPSGFFDQASNWSPPQTRLALPSDMAAILKRDKGLNSLMDSSDMAALGMVNIHKVTERDRKDFVGKGAYGTIYSDEPGSVRKEVTSHGSIALEELNAQAIGAELGLAPRVVAYESAVHGDPKIKGIVMQDLNAPGSAGTPLYKPLVDPGNPTSFVEALTNPWSSTEDKLFALKHYKQMGQLALKGVNLRDRHTGNIFKHEMTGRPMQIDFGITSKVSGEDQVQALIQATEGGFAALGQYDVAEIVKVTAYDYLYGGHVKEAWDFTKEAFASLQKVKNPAAFWTPEALAGAREALAYEEERNALGDKYGKHGTSLDKLMKIAKNILGTE